MGTPELFRFRENAAMKQQEQGRRWSIESRVNKRGYHWRVFDNWMESKAEAERTLKVRMRKYKGRQWRIVKGKSHLGERGAR